MKYLKGLLFATIVIFLTSGTVQAVTVLFPTGGGTGTSTIPTLGQVLVGQSDGRYAPQATSTLGISGGSGTPGGSNTEVQFNDSSAFGGDSGFEYNKTNNWLGVGGTPAHPIDIYTGATNPNGIISLLKTTLDDYTALQIQNSVAAWQFSVRPSGDSNAGGFSSYYSADGISGWIEALKISTGGNLTALGTITGSNLSGTNTGDQTLTSLNAANQQLSNLSGTVAINTSLLLGADGTINLGNTTNGLNDLFLSSGSIFNWANGNAVLTHSSGILTLGTGTLKITNPTNTTTSVVTIDGTQTLTNKTWNGVAIGSTYGGTGLDSSAWAQGDVPYISATGVWNHLAKDATATRYLSNTGTTNNPAWAQVALATGVSGTLPVANGGTNASTFTQGSVVFAGASGTYTQDNTNFFFDDTNNRLGVASTTPGFTLSVGGTSRVTGAAQFGSTIDASDFINVIGASKGYRINGTTLLYASTTNSNVFVGQSVGNTTMTGGVNTVVGVSAFGGNTTGGYNVAIGYGTLSSTNGNDNLGIGAFALTNNQGSNNVGFGSSAGVSNTSGSFNVFVGRESMSRNVTGSYNTGIGYRAGWDVVNTGDGNNVMIGANSCLGITTGINNTCIGRSTVPTSASTTNNRIIISDGSGNQRIFVDTNGLTGIGTTTPLARLNLQSTTEQFRSNYNDGNYWNATTGSTGKTAFDAIGTTPLFSFADMVGFGSTTPYATLSIKGTSGTDPFAVASSTDGFMFGIDKDSHEYFGGTAPTLSSCGTTPSITGDDNTGEVTVGSVSATGCTITFSRAWTNAPSCIITNQSMSVVNAMTYTLSTTAITVSQTGLTGNKLNYQCSMHK